MIQKINQDGKYIVVVCPNPAIDIFARVENFEYGIPNRIREENRYPGGKGLHVAMALSELDHKVKVLGFWGGEAGEWIKKTAKEYYPTIEFVGPKLTEWTRSCYTFKSEDSFDDTEILGPGPTITNEDYHALLDEAHEVSKEASMSVLCGSWPKGSPENGYAELIEIFSNNNVPSFIDCTGVQLENALEKEPFGIHLNRKEITTFFNADFNESKKLITDACKVAAITDGAKGLYYVANNDEHHSVCNVNKVISTIGSGDCLTAGIVSGIVQDLADASIAQLGAACGAANCLRQDLGMMWKSDVENFILK